MGVWVRRRLPLSNSTVRPSTHRRLALVVVELAAALLVALALAALALFARQMLLLLRLLTRHHIPLLRPLRISCLTPLHRRKRGGSVLVLVWRSLCVL